MSIRRKALLSMAMVFLLNILLLVSYYRFYLRDEVLEGLQNIQTDAEETTCQAAALLEQRGTGEIDAILTAQEFSLFDFTVTDIQSGDVLYDSPRQTGDLEVHATAVARMDDRLLLVQSTQHFELGAIRTLLMVQQIIIVEIVIAAVILVMTAVVLQIGLIRPLATLNQQMKDYRQGKKTNVAYRTRRDELGQLAQDFDRLTNALDDEKRMQEQIIASISHDIKTPLTSVMGYVERLLKGDIKDERRVRKYLQTIYARSQSINELVTDFDGYLTSNSRTLNLKPISAEYLSGLLKEEYADELSANGITIEVDNTAGDSSFLGDLSKLRRVFGNLIGNAVKHASSKGPLVIRLFFGREDGVLRFSVSDNGAGVAPEELERIFEPFHTEKSSRGEGSGLGLSICRSIIEAHGGNIHAEKSEQGGLAIIITLPLDVI